MSCTLRRCQGRNGCICPKRPPSFLFSKSPEAAQEEVVGVRILSKTPTKKIERKNTAKVSPMSKITAQNSPEQGAEKKSSEKSRAVPETNQDKNVSNNFNAQSSEKTQNIEQNEAVSEQSIDKVINQVVDDKGNGEVIICYNHYKKRFPISNGMATSTAIDDEYCLSFVFPNCKIHLSEYGPNDFSFEAKGIAKRPVVPEDPAGTYKGLLADNTYWVSIEEDQSESAAYIKRQEIFAQEQASKRAAQEADEARGAGIVKEKKESCSCIEGNPCMESYCCKDWNNRFEVAKKHGWKGFS